MAREVYTPTSYPELENKQPVIFLAGPIQDAPDWQSRAIDILHSMNPDIVIASPRLTYKPGEFDYEKQVNWETYHLNRAAANGAILFWLAKEAEITSGRDYAQTTRAEPFKWKKRDINGKAKLALVIELGLSGERYLHLRFVTESKPGRAYAQTSRAELFEWKERHIHAGANLALGIEEGFSGERYFRLRFSQDCPDIAIMSSLEETCRTAMSLIKQ
jgi:hypothetical protein